MATPRASDLQMSLPGTTCLVKAREECDRDTAEQIGSLHPEESLALAASDETLMASPNPKEFPKRGFTRRSSNLRTPVHWDADEQPVNARSPVQWHAREHTVDARSPMQWYADQHPLPAWSPELSDDNEHAVHLQLGESTCRASSCSWDVSLPLPDSLSPALGKENVDRSTNSQLDRAFASLERSMTWADPSASPVPLPLSTGRALGDRPTRRQLFEALDSVAVEQGNIEKSIPSSSSMIPMSPARQQPLRFQIYTPSVALASPEAETVRTLSPSQRASPSVSPLLLRARDWCREHRDDRTPPRNDLLQASPSFSSPLKDSFEDVAAIPPLPLQRHQPAVGIVGNHKQKALEDVAEKSFSTWGSVLSTFAGTCDLEASPTRSELEAALDATATPSPRRARAEVVEQPLFEGQKSASSLSLSRRSGSLGRGTNAEMATPRQTRGREQGGRSQGAGDGNRHGDFQSWEFSSTPAATSNPNRRSGGLLAVARDQFKMSIGAQERSSEFRLKSLRELNALAVSPPGACQVAGVEQPGDP